LEFFLQTFPQRRQLLLTLRFSFLPQCMLDAAPFLKVTLLKLRALFPFKPQPGVVQSSIHLELDPVAVCAFPLSHYSSLFRSHLHPALGIPSKYLSIFRRHRDPSLPWIVQIRRAAWWGHSPDIRAWLALRLRLGQSGADDQNRDRRDRGYNVCVSSSHKLFSSVANNSSRSATTS
jgi:hypothetical protein